MQKEMNRKKIYRKNDYKPCAVVLETIFYYAWKKAYY